MVYKFCGKTLRLVSKLRKKKLYIVSSKNSIFKLLIVYKVRNKIQNKYLFFLLQSVNFPIKIFLLIFQPFSGLAKDIYMGDEMFGQSALHLAIVHDDYDTVQLLLEKGAAVNARACGNFFLPEDVTDSSSRSYSYQGKNWNLAQKWCMKV